MTPVIDANTADDEDTQDICKMSRLIDDPGKVGPSTYVIIEEQVKQATKGTINWQNSRSQRGGIKASTSTIDSVGPGSYNASMQFFKPMQSSFTRSGLRQF